MIEPSLYKHISMHHTLVDHNYFFFMEPLEIFLCVGLDEVKRNPSVMLLNGLVKKTTAKHPVEVFKEGVRSLLHQKS